MKTLLSIGEAASRLGLSIDTVREMTRTGQLKAVRTPGGHRRFDPAVLDAYLALRSGTAARRRPAPRSPAPPLPARLNPHAVIREEEPDMLPDEDWDEAVTAEPERDVAPVLRPRYEPARPLADQLAEETRLSGLKTYGRSQIPGGVSATARSSVIEALEAYVTAARFPASTDYWTARHAIDAKVAAILEPFLAEAKRAADKKAAEEAKKAQEEQDERRVAALIERGKSHAYWKTLRWKRDESEEVRAEVLEVLEAEVEADWSDGDVEELVVEVLEEYAEESEE